jgi:hypothetical protein
MYNEKHGLDFLGLLLYDLSGSNPGEGLEPSPGSGFPDSLIPDSIPHAFLTKGAAKDATPGR